MTRTKLSLASFLVALTGGCSLAVPLDDYTGGDRPRRDSGDLAETTGDVALLDTSDASLDSGIASTDSGTPDTFVFDTAALDTGTPDTSTPDTGTSDTGTPDTGTPDTGTPDSSTLDTGVTGSDSATGCSFAGTLVTYDLSSKAGTEVSAAATSTGGSVTAGDLSRSSTLSPVSGSGSLNSSGWPSALDKSVFYTFKVTPPAGCRVRLTSLGITVKSSGTGPTAAAITSSIDAFAGTSVFGANTTATVTLSGTGGPGASVEIRVHGYGATSTSGTMRINGVLTLTGALE
ncbi:MAG: hypothetical protein JNL79_05690 [Myxococcales bacterium]|nr:hypothetical protein [Myxococcales bacterium]